MLITMLSILLIPAIIMGVGCELGTEATKWAFHKVAGLVHHKKPQGLPPDEPTR